ncbi:MAG TPA: AAA family ATPase, partial [Candidatus Limnocylindria bacterium]|nr:AAA family ATPase [Candidatus Limnocylindria bacterium]
MKPAPPEFTGTGRYLDLQRIGAGGMGVVYQAFDSQRGMKVALKTLPELDPDAIYRFKQEFRALADLVHPNLCPLYELTSDGGRWFFTMELLDDAVEFFPKVRVWSSSVKGFNPPPDSTAGPAAGDLTLAPNDEATLIAPAFGPRPDEVTLAPPRPQPADDLTLIPGSAVELDRRPAVFQPDDATLDGSSPIAVDDLTLAPSRDGVGEFETLVSGAAATAAEAAQPTRPTGLRWPSPTQDFSRVRAVFRQLAEGVSALHQAGKLHRDLKPGNVVVRAGGQVLLLDFGLVADLVAETNAPPARQSLPPGHELQFASSDRHVLGTVAYMSPEQAAAQPLTPATDWYAMGVMLFQSLTGTLPFLGRPREVLDRKQAEPAPAPADLCEGVPEDLNALCVDLLQTDPARRPSGPQVLARLASGAATAPAADGLSTVSGVLPFIGRQRELDRLEQLYEQARQGRTVICRVQGRSGTGKSAVLRHFLDRVAARYQPLVLAGHCYEQESVPYKALDSVVDALTRHLLRLPPDRLIPLLPDEIGALTRIFPVLNRVPAIAATAAAGDELSDRRELRRRAFQALRELLARLTARQGLIVYIDDLHWGDVDSVELLSELFRPPGAPAFMLLLAYRSEYAQQSACLKDFEKAEALVRLTHVCEQVTIEPLSVTETTELSLTLLGTDTPETRRQAEWVTRESGGGAFFIYELVRAIKSGLAVTLTGTAVVLDDVLWSRVQGLPANSRVLLESVAVAGKPVVLRHVQKAVKLAALPPQLIFSLRSGHLVRTSGPNLDDDIETFHDRVRECVVRRLPADSLREHHGSLAVTLEDTGQADPETLAAHFEGAGGNAKASRYFSAAAASASQVLAFDRAEAFFKKAAALCTDPMERAGIHERMIHFYTDMARFQDAYALLRVAVQPFGIRLPSGFIPPLFIADFLRSKLLIRGRSATALSDLPVMNNPGLQMAVRLINAGA